MPRTLVFYLNVLKRSEKQDLLARIDNIAGRVDPANSVWELNHSDLKMENDFKSDKVKPTTRSALLSVVDNGFSYTFPKHSLTILKLQ